MVVFSAWYGKMLVTLTLQNTCAISCESSHRLSLVFLQCLLLESYQILLPIFIWIHWEWEQFFFSFLARNCLIPRVVWEDPVRERSQLHTAQWQRKGESPSPLLSYCGFRNITKVTGTVWKNREWLEHSRMEAVGLKSLPWEFQSLSFQVWALGHSLVLFKSFFYLF